MSSSKRTRSSSSSSSEQKRQKTSSSIVSSTALTKSVSTTLKRGGGGGEEEGKEPKRLSALAAATVQLSGVHQGIITTLRFHPSGKYLASSSADKTLAVWNVFDNKEHPCRFVFEGAHRKGVTSLDWSDDGQHLFTASADKRSIVWNSETGKSTHTFCGHTKIVNACCISRVQDVFSASRTLFATASDDGSARVWDPRAPSGFKSGGCVGIFRAQNGTLRIPMTGVTFNQDASKLIMCSLDKDILIGDMRKHDRPFEVLKGHQDSLSSIALSPKGGSFLLSNSTDQTLRVWDLRSFVVDSDKRCRGVIPGVQHNRQEGLLLQCSWSADGTMVSSGNSDQHVNIWDVHNQKLLFRLPGHKGSVSDVQFSPDLKQPIIASSSTDRTIFLGEIEPQITSNILI